MIPLKYYGYLVIAALFSYSYYYTYNVGHSSATSEMELKYKTAFDIKLEESLTRANEELQAAMEVQQKGMEKIRQLDQKYNDINKSKISLQEALDEALNKTTTCTDLSDSYYQLYKQLYSNPTP